MIGVLEPGVTHVDRLEGAASRAPRAAARGDLAPQISVFSSRARGAASPWLDAELMVTARDGESLAQIAAEHGARLRRPVGPSGAGAVLVPRGTDAAALRAALAADPRVRSADRAGRVTAAGAPAAPPPERSERSASVRGDADRVSETSAVALSPPLDRAWHLDAMRAPTVASGTLAGYVVAVLDTGIAYENYKEGDVKYRRASSLGSTRFVAPYDFVHDDTHANDDHQHGTHIASLIGSSGTYSGVAPGVALMPVKVLDAESSGSEVDLVDAITYAVDQGADVINMSLCFGEGYLPSAALMAALQYAWDAGVVMVAAAGNDGGGDARYPAASPLVISVGASTLDTASGLEPADYSNTGATLDLLAPGGDLSADRDGDGVSDGLIAESFDPADPSKLGAWVAAGTSQAAALVSGVAVLALDAGAADGLDVALALQAGAGSALGEISLLDGYGLGSLDATGALDAVPDLDALRLSEGVLVSALPWLASLDDGAAVQPMLMLTALDGEGAPLADVEVIASFWGSGGETVSSCRTDSAGVCTVEGPETAALDASGAAAALAFAFGVDGVAVEDRVVFRPGGALFVSDALVLTAEALDDAGLLEGSLLAWRWEAGEDEALGALAESFMLVDPGAAATSRPVGLLFTPAALGEGVEEREIQVDLDGTGLISNPLGLLSVRLLELDGAGLISDPLGISGRSLTVLSASGLISDPLGFGVQDVYTNTGWTLTGAGLISDPLGFSGVVSLRDGQPVTGESLSGTGLGEALASGAWGLASAAPSAEGASLGANDLAVAHP